MLTAFTVENYRAFADRTKIELRPLTLLFGYNNSGKSALVRILPLVADSMKPDVTGPLNLESEAARGAPFDGLITRGSASMSMRIGLELPGRLSVEYVVAQPAASVFQELVSVTITHPDKGTETFELVPQHGGVPAYDVSWNGKPTGIRWTQPFTGLALAPTREGRQVERGPDVDSVDLEVAEEGSDWLNAAFSQATQPWRRRELFWLGSLRRYPKRIFQYRLGGSPPRLGSDGAMAQEILVRDKLTQGHLLPDVSRWYEETFQRRLDAVPREESQWSLVLEPTTVSDATRVPVADTGEGMAQVLPVLLAAAMAKRADPRQGDPRVLAFEQPELHLHPDAHAPLAAHLCGLAADDHPPSMLIETHSENFLLGVQLQIVTEKLPAERVLVYWIQQDAEGRSRATRITFDEEGRPHGGWPPGVFSTDMELTRRLIDERRARKGRTA